MPPTPSTPADGAALSRLVHAIASAPKYRDVNQHLIGRLAGAELLKRRSEKEAEAALRRKLHQILGAFAPARTDYPSLLDELKRARDLGQGAFEAACLRVMRFHASTAERAPLLETFYKSLFAHVRPVTSVLDIGCGLNPLAAPWMGLAAGARYMAVDVRESLVPFLDAYFALIGLDGRAESMDAAQSLPAGEWDVALMLKLLPTLEQEEPGAAARLLRQIPARMLVVSAPTRSLGGRMRGMGAHYGGLFEQWTRGLERTVERIAFPGELCWVLL